jgi:Ran GTPase-activating protein (RanGAP) involved in mRNA processing and transport
MTLSTLARVLQCFLLLAPPLVYARNCTVHDVGKDIVHWNAGLHVMEWDVAGCTTLTATHKKLNDTHIVPLAEHLEGNNELYEINLGYNHLRDASAIAFAKVLEHRHTALTRLNLEGNDIGCGGIKELAHALKENVNLKMLELGRNHIHPDGAKALALAVRINHVLEELDIEQNAFGVEGAVAIASALKYNRHLKKLNLGGNRIGQHGVQALASMLRTNKGLRELDIWGNGIGDHGMHLLERAMRQNNVLTTIDMHHNNAHHEVTMEIALKVASNRRAEEAEKKEIEVAKRGGKMDEL